MIAPRADRDLSLLLTERPSAVDYAAGPVQPPAPAVTSCLGISRRERAQCGQETSRPEPRRIEDRWARSTNCEASSGPRAALRADPKSIQDFKDLIMRQS